MENKIIYSGSKFFGLKIYFQSTGDKEVDAAMKTLFHDSYHRTAPLEMSRPDAKIVMKWYYK